MPVPSADFKKAVKALPEKDKEALLLRIVRKDAELYETLAFELLPNVTLEDVFEEHSERIHDIMHSTSGRFLTKSLTKNLRKAIKEIARFKRITKDVKAETDLHLYLLKLIFDNFTGSFESPYKSFYVATARFTAKTAQLILKKLHEDYHVEYQSEIDNYLEQLRSRRRYNELSFDLPRQLIED